MSSRTKPSPYEILGIEANATPEEIKKAFRKRARSTHPDVAGENSKPAFQEANRAYHLLMDTGRRADFDATGNQDEPKQLPPAVGILLVEFRGALSAFMQGSLVDIGAAIRASIENKISVMASQSAQNSARLEKARKLRPGIKHKAEGANVLGDEIDSGIKELEKAIAEAGRQSQVLKDALEMLDEYEFPMAPPPDFGNMAPAFIWKTY